MLSFTRTADIEVSDFEFLRGKDPAGPRLTAEILVREVIGCLYQIARLGLNAPSSCVIILRSDESFGRRFEMHSGRGWER